MYIRGKLLTYEYKCSKCEHQWEAQQKISEKPLKKCPECEDEESAVRLVSGGQGFVLKGQGWFNSGGY